MACTYHLGCIASRLGYAELLLYWWCVDRMFDASSTSFISIYISDMSMYINLILCWQEPLPHAYLTGPWSTREGGFDLGASSSRGTPYGLDGPATTSSSASVSIILPLPLPVPFARETPFPIAIGAARAGPPLCVICSVLGMTGAALLFVGPTIGPAIGTTCADVPRRRRRTLNATKAATIIMRTPTIGITIAAMRTGCTEFVGAVTGLSIYDSHQCM